MKINEIIVEHIGKVKGGYRLYSHKGKNLGTFSSKAGAEKHEREVQYFKHAGESIEEANLPQAGGLPQAKQPKLKLQPVIKGLAYQWFLIYYGLHHATEPEIVNDRAGYAAELDKVAKKLGQLGFAIQYVPNLPDLGDGGGGEGVYLTHIASKQTAAIDHYDLDQDYEKFLPLAFKALNGSVSETKQRLDPKCWKGKKIGNPKTKVKGGVRVNNCVPIEETYEGDEFYEAYGELWYNEDQQLDEADYHGRKVPLGKPMRGDVKKFKVYVKDPSTGNIKKVNFGDPNMRIKKSIPARRKSFRARHNCDNPGPRTKARYWSCRKW